MVDDGSKSSIALYATLTLDAMVRSTSEIGARLHNAILVIFLVASI